MFKESFIEYFFGFSKFLKFFSFSVLLIFLYFWLYMFSAYIKYWFYIQNNEWKKLVEHQIIDSGGNKR